MGEGERRRLVWVRERITEGGLEMRGFSSRGLSTWCMCKRERERELLWLGRVEGDLEREGGYWS